MGTTPNLGFRYPSGTVGVAPDVAGDIHNLATDVDTALAGSKTIPGNDLNAITVSGVYFGGGSVTNVPVNGDYYWVQAYVAGDVNNIVQVAYSLSTTETFRRFKSGGAWGAWRRFLDADTASAASFGSSASGFSYNRFNVIRYGRVVTIDFSVFRNAGTITGTTSGNIVNVLVGTLGTNNKPAAPWAPLASGPGGPTCSFAMDTNGNLYLCAMPPSYNLVNGQELTCGGSFITNG